MHILLIFLSISCSRVPELWGSGDFFAQIYTFHQTKGEIIFYAKTPEVKVLGKGIVSIFKEIEKIRMIDKEVTNFFVVQVLLRLERPMSGEPKV